MNSIVSTFHLKIQKVEQVCLFDLSWGQGQHLGVTIPYSDALTRFYQDWQKIYLNFYKKALRGRVENRGKLTSPPVDWHARLVQAEAKLLSEFHRWLRHEQLYDLRATIAKAASERLQSLPQIQHSCWRVDIFLCVSPLDLSRLPWEAWEIGTEFAAPGKIRIVRTPIDISRPPNSQFNRQRKARILAILGDDTGLDFKADKEAVQSFSDVAEIQFVGWQPQQSAAELRTQIAEAIKDQRGWDVLFFAGHSNETTLTGGELAIAPNISVNLSEIQPALIQAQKQGLKFAVFNSCKGLSLANALIDLGLSQVAVMREPIHNQVAQEFLLRFLRSLAEYNDAHDALLSACQFLKVEKHLTYPSAYLIPSLFRHPDAPAFRIEPYGWQQKFRRWQPKKTEAIALCLLLGLSWQLSVQEFLLDQRVFVQSIYRNLTHQQMQRQSPPVLMVSIDEESIKRAKISDPRPMDRSYLAKIVDQLALWDTKVVGVDYLLDRYQDENDPILANSLRQAVQQDGTWFIFVSKPNRSSGGWLDVLPEVASPTWSLQGDIGLLGRSPQYMKLIPPPSPNEQRLPLAYWLALGYRMNFEQAEDLPQPQLNSSTQWMSQLRAYLLDTTGQDYDKIFSERSVLHPMTNWAYLMRQWWLQPIIDYSVPPEQVYQTLPAWQLLQSSVPSEQLTPEDPFVVLIAAGGYGEAGVSTEGEDNYPLPRALKYWRLQQIPPDRRRIMPGGEAHAYMVHHWLNRRLVVPIPDLWMVLVAALLGKGTALALGQVPAQRIKWIVLLVSATGVYGLLSLQLYITGAVLLPWVLPTVTFWTYILLMFVKRKYYE